MMESVPRLVVYFLGLHLVFISLLWGWIRCTLSLMENIRRKRLKHTIVWCRILHIVPGITIGILIGEFLCSILCLSECVHGRTWLIICAGFLLAFTTLVGGTILCIWRATLAELVTIFDTSGS